MKIKRLVIFSFFAIAMIAMAGFPTKSQYTLENGVPVPTLVAGRNVNMVSGTDLYKGDRYLQRQNEPSMDVSTNDVRNLLAASNDYSTVDMPESEGELPGAPEGTTAGDAWLGVYVSTDGAESWKHRLLPGHPNDSPGSPLKAFDAASDPTVRALKDGIFLISGIAFDRVENGDSAIFVARYQDIGHDITHDITNIIAYGIDGKFADKPWLAYDIPRPGYPDGIAYVVYSIFLGQLDRNIHSQIFVVRSTDGGKTWQEPKKLSESNQKNQGTTIAIDPNDGTVYIGWRRFISQSGNEQDAMLIAKSVDHGRSFTKAIEVSPPGTIFFDQPTYDYETMTGQFRTYAFPAMAMSKGGQVHMAWSERTGGPTGEARIVVSTSTDGGYTWQNPTYVDDYNENHCYEFMPSMAFWAGKLMIAWYDSQESVRIKDEGLDFQEKWLTDDNTSYWRHTIDVRATQGLWIEEEGHFEFANSIQVSRYLFGYSEGEFIQMQYNASGYPLFKGGTVAFLGDYLDIAPAPRFIFDTENEEWRFNTEISDPSDGYITWTDNRDVHPPDPYIHPPGVGVNPWTLYNAPNYEDCEFGFNTGMRNQNVYVSKITQGIEVSVLESNFSYQDKQVFAINIKNKTGSLDFIEDSITLDLEIIQPSEGSASFLPDEILDILTVTISEHSSVSRQVFVESETETLMIKIEVLEVGGSFTDSVYLYVGEAGSSGTNKVIIEDLGNIVWGEETPTIPVPNIVNPNIVNPNIVNPNIVNPNIVNPNIVNPNIVNPNIVNPNIVNPNIVNPNIVNPNIVNPNIVNPNIVNPNIVNTTLFGADIIDKFWSVKNTGDVASSYTFKTIAGDSLPADTYVYAQLLAYKVHLTPGASAEECDLYQEVHHELILNITPPELSPDISTYEAIVDPELDNGLISNATFSLDPGEEAIVILRVIDTNELIQGFNDDGSFRILTNGEDFDPVSFADNLGAVTVSHSSTEETEVTAITLMILPDSLDPGIVGVPYGGETLRAIGGTGDHYWSVVSGSLPFGMGLSESGLISGCPEQAGDFSFTAEVQDSSSPFQSDTQGFTIHIADPDLLEITMSPTTAPAGMKGKDYSNYINENLEFTATGGVPPYTSWSSSAINNWTGESEDLGFTLPSGGGNSETAVLTGAPLLAGEFNVTVEVFDDSCPNPKSTTRVFFLCIRPIPLSISIDPPLKTTDPLALIDGTLGNEYDVEFHAQYWELPLDWTVTGPLPPGLNPVISGPYKEKMNIASIPEYDENMNYPASYSVTVLVTDNFNVSCWDVPREIDQTFTITINPKEPAWFLEGVDNGEATAVAVDSSGNIFVTGFTQGESTGKDYYTAMYDVDGNFVREMTYNGPGNGDDIPSAIAVDSSGVYVTGSSKGKRSGQDVYTVKYDRLNGDVKWEDRYDGPSHLGDGVNAAALDTAQELFCVAGWVHRGKNNLHADGLVLKYDSFSGELIWDKTYDSRRNGKDYYTAIAIDPTGNILATGNSQESLTKEDTTFDYLTVMYDSSGNILWEVRDDGPGFGDDEPTAIAIDDKTGNVCVTGLTRGGTQGADYYTVMYKSNGDPDPLWGTIGKTYDGPGNGDDVPSAIDMDSDGNVYVTGKSLGTNGYDYATIKYASNNGTPLWRTEDGDDAVRYDGTVGNDEAVAIAVDGTDIYVTGFITKSIEGNGEETDFFTLKYTDSGDIKWIAQYDGLSQMDDVAIAMTVNGTGIYVTGFSWKVPQDPQKEAHKVFATVKYEK